jgi:hypothetical protein
MKRKDFVSYVSPSQFQQFSRGCGLVLSPACSRRVIIAHRFSLPALDG